MSLLDDLRAAEKNTTIGQGCRVCDFIQATEDDETRETLTAAAAGSIGERRFVAIMQAHETGIGRVALKRHRQEGHQP